MSDKKKAEEQKSLKVAEASRETHWKKPSFVSDLFMGRFRADLIFPFPVQSSEDRQAGDTVLEQVKTFLETSVDADRIDREGDIPAEVIQGMKELGLFGIKIPRKYGGLGLSQLNYNRIIQMVASHCASTAVLLSAHQSIGVPQPLKLFGTDEQKAKFLPKLAGGDISAFALTEPGAGSDPSHMLTQAVLSDDGSGYVISGQKLWISNGPIADVMVVMARTNDPAEEHPEITAFIVEGGCEGLSMQHRCEFMGLKGLQNGLLNFDKVFVPKENIIDGLGQGLKLALITLNTGRLTLPAASSGAIQQVLSMVTEWSNDRYQWGAPVGHHEAVASKVATIAAESFAVESVSLLAAAMADAGETDIRLEAAMAKLFCTEALWRCVDAGVQVRGGRGYETADSLRARGEVPMPMERLMRDARINLIIEGTSEIMRLFIAREALDPHLNAAGASATSNKMDLWRASKFYVRWYPPLWVPRFSTPGNAELSSNLNRHLRFVERAGRRLARDLFHMIVRHGRALQKKQMVLARLVDTGADLFAMSAVLSRAAMLPRVSGAESMADLFCRQARRRISQRHMEIYCNHDRFAYKTARQVLENEFSCLQGNIVSTWQSEA